MIWDLKIDGVDFSAYLPRNYSVTYDPILGSNSCYTLDGKYHEDILAYKAVIEIELIPLTPAQLSAIAKACQICKTATYFDTKTNDYATTEAKATLSTVSLIINHGNRELWDGAILTIEER